MFPHSIFYEHVLLNEEGQRSGFLEKINGLCIVPFFNNQYYFTEADIFQGASIEKRIKKIRTDLKEKIDYELFLKRKERCPVYDIYACFQPFNEATKALYPFLKKLQQEVKKGDLILNIWDRNGWMTSLLAGLFPEQHIITTWEGNKDVLGYKGYRFWFDQQENVSIVFTDLDTPLPFGNDSIAFAVGLDAFHRCNQSLLLEELMRVLKNDGAIFFPHVHMTNSEPDPWFERGCKQIHGLEYAEAFKHIEDTTNWNGYIFSEPGLFAANDIAQSTSIPLISTPNTMDYNGLIALLPKHWKKDENALQAFSSKNLETIENAYIIINLLLRIDLNQQKIWVDEAYKEGQVGYLLERHPIYIERIKPVNGLSLSSLTTKALYFAQNGYSIKEITKKIQVKESDLRVELNQLEQLGIIQVLPVANSGMRLQHYLSSQQYLVSQKQQSLQSLWQYVVQFYPENVAIISLKDESEITYEECDEIVNSIANKLQRAGLKKGDRIIICSKIHSEAVLLFWGCMQIGVVAVPIATHLPKRVLGYIENATDAKICFVNQTVYLEKRDAFTNSPLVVFDEEEEIDCFYFADWLEIEEEGGHELIPVSISLEDEAVILFTSGSTGTPKGVQLAHGNLFRSGRHIANTFHWESMDRFFSIGGLESMSGLRNTAIVALNEGAGVVIPNDESLGNVLGIAEAIEQSQATILGGNPVLLRQLVKFSDRVGDQLDSVKTVICTGSNLGKSLRTDFKRMFQLDIFNYYGLTETTGICIAQSPIDALLDFSSIGKPVGCIAQIVSQKGEILPIGEAGHLRILSDNLMQGYLNEPVLTSEVINNGWFYTQDIAKYTVNGSIQLLGRKRNIIKDAGGDLIYLDEIEQFIQSLDEVRDIALCLFEEDDTEKMAAFIIPVETALTSTQLKQCICQKIIQRLGEKKIPNQIHFRSTLPYADNGKLLKTKLIHEIQKRN